MEAKSRKLFKVLTQRVLGMKLSCIIFKKFCLLRLYSYKSFISFLYNQIKLVNPTLPFKWSLGKCIKLKYMLMFLIYKFLLLKLHFLMIFRFWLYL